MGINSTLATAASRGGRGNRPGSFHTYEIPSLEHALFILSEAAQWALRHAPREEAAVVILTLPEEIYRQIFQEGWGLIEPVPGMEDDPTYPPQTVFSPESYSLINDEGIFAIIPLVPFSAGAKIGLKMDPVVMQV